VQQHARSVGLNLLAVLKHELGDLDRVRRVVKVLGMATMAIHEFGSGYGRVLGDPQEPAGRPLLPNGNGPTLDRMRVLASLLVIPYSLMAFQAVGHLST
jgi:hypothetical protein